MSARAKAARGVRDSNHSEIAAAYEELFCLVQDTSIVGGGFPDMVVRIPTRRGPVVALVECKVVWGTLSIAQQSFAALWGSACVLVRSRQDVLAHVERVRA